MRSQTNGLPIGKTAPVRRTLAGFLFALSYAALCLAAGGFLLQRTVFDPDLTADAAAPVLQEPAILKELTKRIAAATTAELGKSTIEIEALVNSVAANAEGASPTSCAMPTPASSASSAGRCRSPPRRWSRSCAASGSAAWRR